MFNGHEDITRDLSARRCEHAGPETDFGHLENPAANVFRDESILI